MKKLKLKPNKYSGKLIVFEGVDGSGKTTLLNLAANYLKQNNIPYIALKMPSDAVKKNPIFDAFDNNLDDTIRNTINLEHLTVFVSGDRLLTQSAQIIPALKQGVIVLCDRYCFTDYMHAPTKLIRSICNEFIKPNLVIMPIASQETLQQRVKMRELEKNNYYNEQNVKEQIKKFNLLAKKHSFIQIDTELSQPQINELLLKTLVKHLY